MTDIGIKIVSLGGIEAIIKAMSTHKDDYVVQQIACFALSSLASNNGMFIYDCLFPRSTLLIMLV